MKKSKSKKKSPNKLKKDIEAIKNDSLPLKKEGR